MSFLFFWSRKVLSLVLALAFLMFVPRLEAENSGPLGFGEPFLSQDMETDRPDFSEGTQTVSPGHFQLEAGYLFLFDDEKEAQRSEHTLPQLLLRAGLVEDLELRLAWDAFVSSEVDFPGDGGSETLEGVGDLSVGFKHRMYDQELAYPSVAFIAELGLPTGGSEVTSDDVIPAFKLLWALDFAKYYSLAGNFNFEGPVEDGERFFEPSASLTLGKDLTGEISAFVEYFGFYPNSDAPDSSSTHFASGGFTWSAGDNLQFDTLAGLGLNDEAEDLFIGLGMAYRR